MFQISYITMGTIKQYQVYYLSRHQLFSSASRRVIAVFLGGIYYFLLNLAIDMYARIEKL